MHDYGEAFRSPEVLLLEAQYFCWSIGVYGFVLWLPSMLRLAAASGSWRGGWLSAAPYLLAAVLMVGTSAVLDRRGRRRGLVRPFLALGAFAFYASYALGAAASGSASHCSWSRGPMYGPYGPFFAWIAEMLPRNVAGSATAVVNGCRALGSFLGSYAVSWLNSAPPEDPTRPTCSWQVRCC